MSQPAPGITAQQPSRLRSYGIGFIVSVFLTAIPFGVVIEGGLSHSATIWFVFSAAIAQALVHLRYFLHLDASPKSRLRVLALTLTALIAALIIGGTVWIMYHLSYNLSG